MVTTGVQLLTPVNNKYKIMVFESHQIGILILKMWLEGKLSSIAQVQQLGSLQLWEE